MQKLNNYFKDDNEINEVIQYIQDHPQPNNNNRFHNPLAGWKKNKYIHFILRDNKLVYKPLNLIVVPKTEINNVLKQEYNNDIIFKTRWWTRS